MSTTASATAGLSTTSEGIWLTAALLGVRQLPEALRVRPVGSIAETVADHPGLEVLEAQGVCRGRVVDSDVAEWIGALGRPDIEVDVVVSRPQTEATREVGPPPLFTAPDDPYEAAAALAEWHRQRARRVAVMCRRDDQWVSAVRLWRAGEDAIDDIVVTPLGAAPIGTSVTQVLGSAEPAQFHGINIETDVLRPILTDWQQHPHHDVVGELVHAGVSVPQARIIRSAVDASATQVTLAAAQFTIDGPEWASLALSISDTLSGRVLVSNSIAPDGQQWTTLLPGTGPAIETAVGELLESLPAGAGWTSHRRD